MERYGVKRWLNGLVQVIFPKVCVACAKELPIKNTPFCVECTDDIPFTTHFEDGGSDAIVQKFWGKVNVQYAGSLTYFVKGSHIQEMIHRFKYLNKSHVGLELGKFVGQKIKDTSFAEIDLIIPVPLHYLKEQKRGYNQAKIFGLGIAEVLEKPICDNVLYKTTHNKSQTDKGREHRYQNVLDSFVVKNTDLIHAKHILIVDDVITTGATLEACLRKLIDATNNNITISILTISMVR